MSSSDKEMFLILFWTSFMDRAVPLHIKLLTKFRVQRCRWDHSSLPMNGRFVFTSLEKDRQQQQQQQQQPTTTKNQWQLLMKMLVDRCAHFWIRSCMILIFWKFIIANCYIIVVFSNLEHTTLLKKEKMKRRGGGGVCVRKRGIASPFDILVLLRSYHSLK